MRRLVALALVAFAWLTLTAAVAAHGCELTTESPPDTSNVFIILGESFHADDSVELDVLFAGESVMPTRTTAADGDGDFAETLSFTPNDPAGEYTIRATAGDCQAEAVVTVVAMPDTAIAPTSATAAADGLVLIAAITFAISFVIAWRGMKLGESR